MEPPGTFAFSTNRVLNKQVRGFIRNGEDSRGGAGTVRGARMIATGGGTMLVIVVMMIHSIGSEIEGEMIAGDPKGIVTGTVRGAGVTGGDVTIAGRLSHGDCGRWACAILQWSARCGGGHVPPGPLRRRGHVSPAPLLSCWTCSSGSSMSERESKLMGGYSRVCGIQAFFQVRMVRSTSCR